MPRSFLVVFHHIGNILWYMQSEFCFPQTCILQRGFQTLIGAFVVMAGLYYCVLGKGLRS